MSFMDIVYAWFAWNVVAPMVCLLIVVAIVLVYASLSVPEKGAKDDGDDSKS